MSSITKAAVLCGKQGFERWAACSLRTMVQEENVTISHIVIDSSTSSNNGTFASLPITEILERGLWAIPYGYHLKLNRPDYLKVESFNSHEPWLGTPEIIECEPEPFEGLGQRLPKEVTNKIASEVDVVIRRGFGILKGEILTAPEHGVLSFHHGDIRKYRGRPPAVWEWLNGEPVVGATLQQLTPELDGGRIIVEKHVDIRDADSWQEAKRRSFVASEDMLATAVRRLQDPEFEPTTPDSLGELYTDPGALETLRVVIRNILN